MGLSMRADIKERWLAELRSGERKQGKAALHRINQGETVERFCCLGVLAHMMHEEGGVTRIVNEEKENGERWAWAQGVTTYVYGGNSAYLPVEVIEWAGIRWSEEIASAGQEAAESECRYGLAETQTLARANDNGMTFEQIADIIEREVEGV